MIAAMSDEPSEATPPDPPAPTEEIFPSTEVRAAIEAALQVDETRLGDVFRLQIEGLSPAQMAERLEVQNFTFVYSYRQQLDALLEDKIPRSPSIAGQTASRVKKWRRRPDWSAAVRSYLNNLFTGLDAISTDPQLVQQEDSVAALETQKAESRQVPGVYVYSLPHYLRHRFDPTSGRTLLKVGCSDRDVFLGWAHKGKQPLCPKTQSYSGSTARQTVMQKRRSFIDG
jgi:hypothetical protein